MTNRIKELRIAANLTQEELADLAGTTFQQISRLEKGGRKLTLQWMKRLAPHLRVKWQELAADDAPVAPSHGEFVTELDELALLHFWRSLTDEGKRLFLRSSKPPPVQNIIKMRRRGPQRENN